MFHKIGTRIQFRDYGENLICGRITGWKPFCDPGKEMLGCDFHFTIAAKGGTRNGKPLKKDLSCTTDGWSDATTTYFIGDSVMTSLGRGLNYLGTVVDFRTQSGKHQAGLTLKKATINGVSIGNVRLTVMELYEFYDAVKRGVSTFTDAHITFSPHHAIDIDTVKGHVLRLTRVVIDGDLQVVSKKKTSGTIELVDVVLKPPKNNTMFPKEAGTIIIPKNPLITVSNTRRTLKGRPVSIQQKLKAVFFI